jgi:hypothetical protein
MWVLPEFQFTSSRGGIIAKPYVHIFFIGLGVMGFAGLFCTFFAKLQRLGIILFLACSSLLWISCLLMMVRVVPPWFSVGLSLLVMAVPISLAAIVLRPGASRTYHNTLIASSSIAVIAIVVMMLKPPWHLQVFENTRVLDAESPFWNELHKSKHATALGRFRLDFMLWSLSGYPPHYFEYERQREALVRLGYFQKRVIALEGVRLHHVTPEIDNIPTKDGLWIIIPNTGNDTVTVYACTADMPLIEATFERAKQLKNPGSGR